MLVRLQFQNVLAANVGAHGIPLEELVAAREEHASILEDVHLERRAGKHAFLDLPYQAEGAKEWAQFGSGVGRRYKNIVVIGMGGSSLGFAAIHRACSHPFANLKSRRAGSPRVFVLDNIDPDTVSALLEVAKPRDTFFNVISKSGSTPETAANFFVILEKLRKARPDTWREHLAITTDPDKGPLRSFASREGIASFPVPPGVSGRFSALSAVGMLPAAAAGIPIDEVLEGAREMDVASLQSGFDTNIPFQIALIHTLLARRHKSIAVMMPYSDGLSGFSLWFRQLWAESLGKRLDLSRKEVHAGQTPVVAAGAADQHSQIQLYVEGPNDKVIGFLALEKHRKRVRIPSDDASGELGYLGGTGLDRVLRAEREGTQVALTRANRPNYTITIPTTSPKTIGALLYLFEAAVVYAGRMLGINPYDQPGVEAGKKAAAALLGQEGTEDEKKALRAFLRPDKAHTLEW
ncbi:MAG: glucose-6-phosphate isomerase [Planctomycetota bacterium]|nr:glucose-6-phosphate isomerase [Planctomycetota bacterium]